MGSLREKRENSKWNTAAKPPVSVLVVGHRSAKLLRRALASLFAQAAPERYELILLVNGSDAAVTRAAEELHADAPVPALLLFSEEVRPGFARTLAIPHTRGETVLFLDDDVELFQDVVSRAADLFHDPSLHAAGGANLTPPDSTALERASGAVLESFWGTMSMRFRYKPSASRRCTEHSLILCNLAVRRSVLLRSGGFPHGLLVSNEENVLLQQLAGKEGKLMTDPGLAVYHRRRGTWSGIAQQSRKYGSGRGQNILILPETTRFFYFLPSVLLLSLLWSFLPFLLYFFIGALFSAIRFFRTRDGAAFCLQPFVYPVVHFSYGFGFILAVAQWGWRREVLCGASE